jgi:hypothetical protein
MILFVAPPSGSAATAGMADLSFPWIQPGKMERLPSTAVDFRNFLRDVIEFIRFNLYKIKL